MSDTTTVLHPPYADEPRLQRDDILARLLGISQLEYENDFYTHHDGSVWDYFGEIDLKQSTDESARFWVWVQSDAGLQGEIDEDGIVFDHSLNATYGTPIEMGDEIGELDAQQPRYNRAYAELPAYVWVIKDRREWRDKSIQAADDASYGYAGAIERYNEAQQQLPGKRPQPSQPVELDIDGNPIF
jgi:hypothetical protein